MGSDLESGWAGSADWLLAGSRPQQTCASSNTVGDVHVSVGSPTYQSQGKADDALSRKVAYLTPIQE